MNEAMAKELREIYELLTDEQKEKVEACSSVEELNEFAGRESSSLFFASSFVSS